LKIGDRAFLPLNIVAVGVNVIAIQSAIFIGNTKILWFDYLVLLLNAAILACNFIEEI
jgi:hypothetical protein